MAFVKCLVLLLSVAASTSALATPHAARHSVHHRAIAARVADPAPLDVLPVPIRKRADTKRCKQRASSSTGQGTFYATGLGSCGITNKDTDYIAAVSHLLYDQGYAGVNPNNNPICGRTVTATYQGKSVTVAVTDRCEGCAITDLDFSPSAFNQLADFSVGRISGMTWTWN
ncbi:expansin family protein [Laccaria bicolor S238N-H82]|uniref:Expansin family protein n=1 Tax=Laccaria bicolor (strain S238N-H82 / ATCC MYA-4686) TaxID=486041 RepID=B0CQ69_LACBS|nr:expansin family protein [Laccaria bicolor S238N-H82]EDR15021.1 expansin family protein [Laccaria bicolor S238N-H82]|eukprot:XP_001873229.1 expansin family protein [Laccaria bicolor S238N-H82]